jgi:hypothetical protein
MGRVAFWEKLRELLRREKQDLDEVLGDFQSRANASLDEREAEMNASPAEKLAIEEERAREADAEYEEVRRRIEGDTGR